MVCATSPVTALWFSLAALAKETAILAPLALLAWVLMSRFIRFRDGNEWRLVFPRHLRNPIALLFPLLPLTAWYTYHYLRTGMVFGNPEFFRYNVEGTLQPLRILLALLIRLWQTFGYLHLLFLTVAAFFALKLPPLQNQKEGQNEGQNRERRSGSPPSTDSTGGIQMKKITVAALASSVLAAVAIGLAGPAPILLPAQRNRPCGRIRPGAGARLRAVGRPGRPGGRSDPGRRREHWR